MFCKKNRLAHATSAAAAAIAICGLSHGGTALAQTTTLEEVLVTAQKREQTLQEAPIAVSAFDADSIERLRIRDVEDVSLYAPNVEIVETPSSATGATIAIRGASAINPAITWENSVGMYLDGVFIGKNLGGIFDVVELERVEVLRGPQGTLYGKNTVGGAVNLITRKPSGEFGGKLRAEAGDYGLYSGYLSIDTPDMNGFKATLTGFGEQRDGFVDNNADPYGNIFATGGPGSASTGEPAPSSKDFQDMDSVAARVALLWDVNDCLQLGYAYDYSDKELNPKLAQLTQVGTNSSLSAPPFLGQALYLTDDDEFADDASNDFARFENSETQGHAFTATWTSDGLTFKSITSYRELDWEDGLDIDGTPIDIFHSDRYIDYDQFSQEFQLIGSTDQLNYVLGAYYFEEEADVFNPITFFGVFGIPTLNNSYGLDNDAWAAYGQVDWRPAAEVLQDRLTITLGARYTEESKDQYIDHPGAFADKADKDWSNFSPNLTLAWAFTDDVNGYFRVAEGWKSGGFNGEASSPEGFRDAYDPEEVIAYELGLKTRLLDNRVQLNLAAFYNDVSDVQLSVFEGLAAASLVVNVPDYTSQGFEAELVALITEDLRVTASYGYLDTEYDRFPKGFFFDKDEAGVPYAPENSATVGIDWTIARMDMGVLDLHVDWSYLDEYTPFIDPDQVKTSTIEDRSLLNARLSLGEMSFGGDNQLSIALWGKNLTDEEYRINTIPFGGVDQRLDPSGDVGVGWTVSYMGEPRTYGVEVTYDF
jgi:iron complex outermembrane receptor protein